MSDRLLAGHVPFSMYQRSTAALIVALLWALTFCLAVSLETVTRGTMIAAMMPEDRDDGQQFHQRETRPLAITDRFHSCSPHIGTARVSRGNVTVLV